jgi:hypothetical protein
MSDTPPNESAPATPPPPSSLSRSADETYLRAIEHRINIWMMRHAHEHFPHQGAPPHLLVAKYFYQLWELVPEALKTEYARVRARLDQPAEQAGAKDGRPRQLLVGWRDIADALDMKYQDRRRIQSLNQSSGGPINARGKGTRPRVYLDDLLRWWNQLAVRQQELANRREGARLSAQAQHAYGREGTTAPEVGGGVKKRRPGGRPNQT